MRDIDLSALAREVVQDITSQKEGLILGFQPTTYIAITNDGDIEDSDFPYILKYADIGVILIPYNYLVISQEDYSQYVIFIDNKGIPNNKIRRKGWTLYFDTPITQSYRTYVRRAVFKNDRFELSLPVHCIIEPVHFKKVWDIFVQLSEDVDMETLKQLGEEYRLKGGCPTGYPNIIVRSLS